MRREESPEPVPEGGPAMWWDRIVVWYDLWYHRLRFRWPWFLVFLLSTIVCCSIATGWSFRLKTFNIADRDSVNLNANVRFIYYRFHSQPLLRI